MLGIFSNHNISMIGKWINTFLLVVEHLSKINYYIYASCRNFKLKGYTSK